MTMARGEQVTEYEGVGGHDCGPLLPIGVKDMPRFTCPECGTEWFFASGPLEGDWFKAAV